MSARRRTILNLYRTRSAASIHVEHVVSGLPDSFMRFYMRAPRSDARARYEQLAYSRSWVTPHDGGA